MQATAELRRDVAELRIVLEPRERDYEAIAQLTTTGDSFRETVEFDFEMFDAFALEQSQGISRALQDSSVRSARYLGGRLFDALFGKRIGAVYKQYRAQFAGIRLRIALPSGDRALRLPWELMYESPGTGVEGRAGDFVALAYGTIVREISRPELEQTPTPIDRLRVLFVAYTEPQMRYSVEAELEAMKAGLGPRGEIDVCQHPTEDELRRRFDEQRPHVVHYVGTGVSADPASQAILLADAAGGRRLVGQRRWLEEFRMLGLQDIRLVVLNGCQTDLFAAALARVVPAVVGMRGDYLDQSAVSFAGSLYRGIGGGAALDQAIASARRELNYSNPGSLEWGAPVLYQSGPALPLLAEPEITVVAAPLPPERAAAVSALPRKATKNPEREYLTARLDVDRKNLSALEERLSQAGASSGLPIEGELERLRKRIAETESMLRESRT